MKKESLKELAKLAIKSPSPNFTNKVMSEISVLEKESLFLKKWNVGIIYLASLVLLCISVFVKFPDLNFYNYTIKFSPIVMPIFSLIFVFIIYYQLDDLTNRSVNLENKNVIIKY